MDRKRRLRWKKQLNAPRNTLSEYGAEGLVLGIVHAAPASRKVLGHLEPGCINEQAFCSSLGKRRRRDEVRTGPVEKLAAPRRWSLIVDLCLRRLCTLAAERSIDIFKKELGTRGQLTCCLVISRFRFRNLKINYDPVVIRACVKNSNPSNWRLIRVLFEYFVPGVKTWSE